MAITPPTHSFDRPVNGTIIDLDLSQPTCVDVTFLSAPTSLAHIVHWIDDAVTTSFDFRMLSGNLNMLVNSPTLPWADFNLEPYVVPQRYRVAFRIQDNLHAASVNGKNTLTDTGGIWGGTPASGKFGMGCFGHTGAITFTGELLQVNIYYGAAFTNAELKTLSGTPSDIPLVTRTDIDAVLLSVNTQTAVLDGYLQQQNAEKLLSVDANIIRILRQTKSLDLNALLAASATKTASLDAYLSTTGSKSLTADAQLQKAYTLDPVSDAYLAAQIAITVGFDAQVDAGPSFVLATFDARFKGATTFSTEFDAHIIWGPRSYEFHNWNFDYPPFLEHYNVNSWEHLFFLDTIATINEIIDVIHDIDRRLQTLE